MQLLKFTVDSALLRELGEKLVETVHLALVELVKNCYDADATEVDIVFDYDEKGKSRIKIIDNGTGMSFDAIQNFWMRIATTNKNEKRYSTVFGRPLTGAKGIGRFCCRRLGGRLELITYGTKAGDKIGMQRKVQKSAIKFPWVDFAPGTDVTEIECDGEQIEVENVKTGTTLIITDISEEWTTSGLNWLKRQLAVLAVNRGAKRFTFQDDLGFNVKLTAPDFEGGIRDLREDFLNAGWGTITAYINNKHQAVCELNALGIGRKNITSTVKYPMLQDISLKIAVFVEEKGQMRDTSVLSKGTLTIVLPEWGGVQVRYKGFRVFPYGDDDWLDIDHDRGLRKGNPSNELNSFAQTLRGVDPKRSLLNMLSMRSYMGNVEIGEKAVGFEMKLNREGFIASEAVTQLRDFVRFAIDWSTILRDYYIRQETEGETISAKNELERVIDEKVGFGQIVDSAVNYIEKEVENITVSADTKQKAEIQKSFHTATEAIRKYNETTKLELSHLRLVASTSTLLLVFSHEVKSLLGVLEESKNSLNILAKTLQPKQRKEIHEMAEIFDDLKTRLKELLEFTSLLSTNKKAKPGQVSLREKIIRVEKIFDLIVNRYEIEIDYKDVPNNIIITKILEAEVYSILINVLSNSIKSVIAGGDKRKIQISAVKEGSQNIIKIRDSGLGLHSSKYEEVFIPFISDPEGKLYRKLDSKLNPEDKLIVGSGSGLGLGIVKEITEARGGSVHFIKPKSNWSTELEIKLP